VFGYTKECAISFSSGESAEMFCVVRVTSTTIYKPLS
jgi:hypothetical protein